MSAMSYEVHLEMFEGPLDLLLFLIKKNDLDIYNIPIAQITQEYLGYLDLMKEINLDLAGEFLVLAATLMAIKSKTLLPSQEEEAAAEGPDPQAELVARIVEYQRFKEAAKLLESRAERFKDVWYRGAPRFHEAEKSLSIGFMELLGALRDVLERCEDKRGELVGEEFPIEEKMSKIVRLMEGRESVTWDEIYAGETKRRGVIACFFAMLELIKLERITVRQDRPRGAIVVFKRSAPDKSAMIYS